MRDNWLGLVVGVLLVAAVLGSSAALAAQADTKSGEERTRLLNQSPNETDSITVTIGSERVCGGNTKTDDIGTVAGCRYDTSFNFATGESLNRTELKKLIARTVARVERVRQLDMTETLRVTITSREQYIESELGGYSAETTVEMHRQNALWEGMFMIDGRTDATRIVRESYIASTSGSYLAAENEIVYVSDNETRRTVDEVRLSELVVHSLQSQHFETASSFNFSTPQYSVYGVDSMNGYNGLINGDSHLVQYRYETRCDSNWTCQRYEQAQPPEVARLVHPGVNLLNRFPEFEGVTYVSSIEDDGGWSAVNSRYANPPNSTTEINYDGRRSAGNAIELPDTSDSTWQRVESESGDPARVSFGEAGIASMLMYTYYERPVGESSLISDKAFFNSKESGNGLREPDPISFDRIEFSKGYEGDVLYPYVKTSSNEASAESSVRNDEYWVQKTGYVWRSSWASTADSREFTDGYVSLLKYHGATAVPGFENTYRISSGEEFEGVYHINRTGQMVTITKAPSVESLSAIRPSVSPPMTYVLNETWFRNVVFLLAAVVLAGVIGVALKRSPRVIAEE